MIRYIKMRPVLRKPNTTIEMTPRTQRYVTYIFYLLCICGLFIHVGQISEKYFKYSVTNRLAMDLPNKLKFPALSLCWRYADILDYKLLNKEQNLDLVDPMSRHTSFGFFRALEELKAAIKMSYIFDYSPDGSTIIEGCSIRFPNKYRADALNQSECQSYFNVTKYYVAENVCYRFAPIESLENQMYDYAQAKSALTYPGMAYQVHISGKAFEHGRVFSPIVHRGKVPKRSRYLSPEITRFQNRSSPKANVFVFTYKFIQTTRLESPYETKCSYYDGESQPTCFRKCLINKTLQAFDKIPFTEMIKEHGDYSKNLLEKQIISDFDMSNQTYFEQLRAFEQQCKDEECRNVDCEQRLYLTGLEAKIVDESEENLTFRVNLPSSPNYYLKYQPMLELEEYAVYVLGCFGIWLGVCVMNLNPVKLVKRSRYVVSDNHPEPAKTSTNRLFHNSDPSEHHLLAEFDVLKKAVRRFEERMNSINSEHRRASRHSHSTLVLPNHS